MKNLIYVPLEPYRERYTFQLSSEDGWFESNWKNYNVDFIRVDGEPLTNIIRSGQVLDASGRGFWACSQIMKILQLMDSGWIDPDDTFYFDDFWHPGIEALFYSFALHNIKPKIYSFLWAQSVDIHDFTYPMRHWIRHFEKGIAAQMSGIFVTSTCLRDMCLYAGIGTPETVHVTGLPFNSVKAQEFFPDLPRIKQRQVVFSSRWDIEKRPDIFLQIAEKVIQFDPTIKFIITTSAPKLRSNMKYLLHLLDEYLEKYPDNIFLRENQSKTQYYTNLLDSKIQINTADQDFVSWTLLEATLCGCRPLYPYYLSFPEALDFRADLMYAKNDIDDAARMILKYIDAPEEDWSWVYEKFDRAWYRKLQIMRGQEYESLY